MKSKLEELGAQVLELPLIRIIPTQDRKLVTVFSSIATYDWVVFTSANGAREFMRLFFLAYGDIRSFWTNANRLRWRRDRRNFSFI